MNIPKDIIGADAMASFIQRYMVGVEYQAKDFEETEEMRRLMDIIPESLTARVVLLLCMDQIRDETDAQNFLSAIACFCSRVNVVIEDVVKRSDSLHLYYLILKKP